jgi:uncharacterized protein YlxP (DUF503 family)
VLTLELRIEDAQLQSEHAVKGLKDRLRARFNVAVAEIDFEDVWQRALVAAVTVSSSRENAEKVLQAVEEDAANQLGGSLVGAATEWL